MASKLYETKVTIFISNQNQQTTIYYLAGILWGDTTWAFTLQNKILNSK